MDGDKDAYDGDLLWSLMWGIWTYYRGGCHTRELFHETRRPYVRANINHILSHCDVLGPRNIGTNVRDQIRTEVVRFRPLGRGQNGQIRTANGDFGPEWWVRPFGHGV